MYKCVMAAAPDSSNHAGSKKINYPERLYNAYNAPMVIDSMTYHYAANTNRLTSLSDGATPVSGYEHAVSSSYTYDNSGNLKEDNGSGLKDIGYNPYGKIDSLKNNNTGNTVYFLYDGLGRRVKKTTGSDEEYYVYDAGDKLIAVYPNGTVSNISQRFIYGLNGAQEIVIEGANYAGAAFHGSYLLNDHLGNVRALHNGSSTPAISAYNNYYAFGSLQPDSYYNTLNSKLGFNGQARDDDFNGVGNFNTAKFWEYDTRIGRRWELDPVPNANLSNYSVLGSNPINNVDVNGDYFWGFIGSTDKQRKSAKAFAKETGGDVKQLIRKSIHVDFQKGISDFDGTPGVIAGSRYFHEDGSEVSPHGEVGKWDPNMFYYMNKSDNTIAKFFYGALDDPYVTIQSVLTQHFNNDEVRHLDGELATNKERVSAFVGAATDMLPIGGENLMVRMEKPQLVVPRSIFKEARKDSMTVSEYLKTCIERNFTSNTINNVERSMNTLGHGTNAYQSVGDNKQQNE